MLSSPWSDPSPHSHSPLEGCSLPGAANCTADLQSIIPHPSQLQGGEPVRIKAPMKNSLDKSKGEALTLQICRVSSRRQISLIRGTQDSRVPGSCHAADKQLQEQA